jgi:2-desacetyl-2-hydroxyethyl bacteriochlorophyllide A dehydrogenase
MKAARLVGPRQFEILDVETPTPKPGEVLVRMEYASICGSDLLRYDRVLPEEDYPLGIGLPCHETTGIVEESMDDSLKKGDRVVALTYTGGLMEYTTIAANRCIYVPENVPAKLAVLCQPIGTVIYAVQKLGSVLGKRVVILGQGPIGLSFTEFMSRAGATQVIVTDIVDARLDVAKKHFGATHTINSSREDVIERVREITEGALGDVVIDACGIHETNNQTFHCLRVQGTACIFGMPHGDPVFPFDWGTMYMKLPNIIVCNSARAGEVVDVVKTAVDLIGQGRINPEPMITHDVPFSDVGRAYELFSRRMDGAVKPIIKIS